MIVNNSIDAKFLYENRMRFGVIQIIFIVFLFIFLLNFIGGVKNEKVSEKLEFAFFFGVISFFISIYQILQLYNVVKFSKFLQLIIVEKDKQIAKIETEQEQKIAKIENEQEKKIEKIENKLDQISEHFSYKLDIMSEKIKR